MMTTNALCTNNKIWQNIWLVNALTVGGFSGGVFLYTVTCELSVSLK